MSIFVRTLIASVSLLILVSFALAQEPPKPVREHDHLKLLAGTWIAETDSGNGIMTYKMELGGLWLVGDFDGEFGGIKFLGKGLDTYDPETKKFRSVWVDSFSTAPRIMEGILERDGKTMTLAGEGRGPDGMPAKYKSVTAIKDPDTVTFGLFLMDNKGGEQSLVQITYKRKK